jgi:hypothetical protein
MRRLPAFTASHAVPSPTVVWSLPTSPERLAPRKAAWRGVSGPASSNDCNDAKLILCRSMAQQEFQDCLIQRRGFRCLHDYRNQLLECGLDFGCLLGKVCVPDAQNPGGDGKCCDPGQVACGPSCQQQCIPPKWLDPFTCQCECPTITCSPPQVLDPNTCQCVCPPTTCPTPQMVNPNTCQCECPTITCSPPQVLNPNTCQCECPPTTCTPPQVHLNPNTCQCECPATVCTGGKNFDPQTCTCKCPAGLNDCAGTCTDLSKDFKNCGMCGNWVGPFQGCCNGTPTDLTTDTHCGSCTLDCTAHGLTCCRDRGGVFSCVNTDSDPQHCGGCQPCPGGGFVCQHGQCVCPSSRACGSGCCPSAAACCHDKNVDYCAYLQRDPQNCGSCGHKCATGQDCCPPGVCIDLQTDQHHCGSCPTACQANQLCCSGNCVASDIHNCGVCSNDCYFYYSIASGGSWGSCVSGQCRCPTGYYGVQANAFGDIDCCPVGTSPCADGVNCGAPGC